MASPAAPISVLFSPPPCRDRHILWECAALGEGLSGRAARSLGQARRASRADRRAGIVRMAWRAFDWAAPGPPALAAVRRSHLAGSAPKPFAPTILVLGLCGAGRRGGRGGLAQPRRLFVAIQAQARLSDRWRSIWRRARGEQRVGRHRRDCHYNQRSASSMHWNAPRARWRGITWLESRIRHDDYAGYASSCVSCQRRSRSARILS